MRLLNRPLRAGGAAVLGLAAVAATGAFAGAHAASVASPSATPRLTAIKNSLPATTDRQTGTFTAANMSVEVALAPQHEANLAAELRAVYTKGSRQYDRFLAEGQFDRLYAPSTAERASVASYLANEGLKVTSTSSPFLIRVAGSSAKITAAFHTKLTDYVDPRGIRYYSNSQALSVPTSIVGSIQGVVGLTNTVREHTSLVRPLNHAGKTASKPAAKSSSASCETGYPTDAQLFSFYVGGGSLPYGYGGGPGCSGLTPSQTNSMYGAPAASPRTQGAGVTAAVFELSAYQQSDIDTWASTLLRPALHAAARRTSPSTAARSPRSARPATAARRSTTGTRATSRSTPTSRTRWRSPRTLKHPIVYNAPNDYTGQTELDEYTAIANQDTASTISSSWGVCENDVTAGYVAGGEHHLRADGAAGPERVQLRG